MHAFGKVSQSMMIGWMAFMQVLLDGFHALREEALPQTRRSGAAGEP
jgi:hypothetical protein